ncbi:hypothetical protein C8Q80DRAFT_178180 [Daedaleopsis nitida]|nr:hypothetical protein C8Q80DRAFT_178180 [Daedaleopsis nitida]
MRHGVGLRSRSSGTQLLAAAPDKPVRFSLTTSISTLVDQRNATRCCWCLATAAKRRHGATSTTRSRKGRNVAHTDVLHRRNVINVTHRHHGESGNRMLQLASAAPETDVLGDSQGLSSTSPVDEDVKLENLRAWARRTCADPGLVSGVRSSRTPGRFVFGDGARIESILNRDGGRRWYDETNATGPGPRHEEWYGLYTGSGACTYGVAMDRSLNDVRTYQLRPST